jgi:abortive infection bacteriophage resistance protein
MRTPAGFFFVSQKVYQVEFSKPPLDIPAQIKLLKSRGMTFADEDRAIRVLSHVNYYRLRAYWLPFEKTGQTQTAENNHSLQDGTEFDDIYSLYVFDRRLRVLLLEAIERVEIALRTHWAQVLAEKYGAHAYLNEEIFFRKNIHANCIASLDEELQRSKETFVKHYQSKYTRPSRPPIWAITELLTLGGLSKWIENINARQDRQAIAERFQLDEIVVRAFAHHLTHIRNICAHHGRVWNRKFTLIMTIPKKPKNLHEQFNRDQIEERKIYNTLVMLSWCIRAINPQTTWPHRVRELLITRSTQELKAMGALEGWQEKAPFST